VIGQNYIRSARIREAFNALLERSPQLKKYESVLTNKLPLTFHDANGKLFKNNVEPHFALTSELQYWIKQDKGQLPSWWDVCDIIVAYWLYNITSGGRTYTDQTAAECTAFIRSLEPFDDWKIKSVLGSFARRASEISYGKYLYNPVQLIGVVANQQTTEISSNNSSGIPQDRPSQNTPKGGGIKPAYVLAGIAGLIAIKNMNSNNKKRR